MFYLKLEKASIRSYIKVYISFKPSINKTREDWKRFRRNKCLQEEKQRVMTIQEVTKQLYREIIFLSYLRYGYLKLTIEWKLDLKEDPSCFYKLKIKCTMLLYCIILSIPMRFIVHCTLKFTGCFILLYRNNYVKNCMSRKLFPLTSFL